MSGPRGPTQKIEVPEAEGEKHEGWGEEEGEERWYSSVRARGTPQTWHDVDALARQFC